MHEKFAEALRSGSSVDDAYREILEIVDAWKDNIDRQYTVAKGLAPLFKSKHGEIRERAEALLHEMEEQMRRLKEEDEAKRIIS